MFNSTQETFSVCKFVPFSVAVDSRHDLASYIVNTRITFECLKKKECAYVFIK